MRFLPTSLAIAAALLALPVDAPVAAPDDAPDADRPDRPPRVPAPTENWLAPGAEQRNKSRRKAWFRERHKAPPGVDWAAAERANGLAQVAKRNALSMAPDPALAAWVERGSENQAGRMHVAAHSSDGVTLYAGSAKGGVWRGARSGEAWTPIGDNLYGGAHWLVALSPAAEGDPDIVLAATDDGLVHRSDDDGATWITPADLPDLGGVRRLLMATDGSEAVFLLGAQGRDYTLFRSTDAGASFEAVYDLDRYAGDLWAPRDGGGRLYLLADDAVYTSDDLGDSWGEVGPTGIGGTSGELVGSEAGAPRLWMVSGRRVYRSDDAGESWSDRGGVSDYWGSLNASITDADVFAYGGVEVHRTFDGGESWGVVNYWYDYYDRVEDRLHADIPGLDVVPSVGGEIWYISTDGGLYRSPDSLRTVENLSLRGLRVSQYYGTLTSTRDPAYVAAGAQDQGYQVTGDLAQDDDVLEFDQVISGDYAHLTSGDGTHDLVYSVYPGFILLQAGAVDPGLAYIDFPSGEAAAWLPPLLADPEDPEAFWFCASHLYRYERNGAGWTWSQSRWSEQDFGANPGEYISGFALSPADRERAYAVTNYGRLFSSDDRALTWTESDDVGPGGQYFYGTALVASALDDDLAYVGGSGYGAPAVYRTTDGGQTWEDFGEGLPDTLVYSLGEAPDGSGVLVAGTETAAYRRDPGADAWVDVTGAAAPVTIYWSVEALQRENTMRFGTYGRGIWDYQLDPENTSCYPVVDADGDGVDCLSDCDDGDATIFPGAEELCDGVDQNCDPGDLDESDGDGDGFLACEECDDGDHEVFPGAEELCDGVDQNCDPGDLDEADADLDGWFVCEECDDDDPDVNPGVVEACDGVDRNCDPGDLDEADADGDGFLACEECDDDDPTAHPDAEEICGDGLDQDCSGEDLACGGDTGDPVTGGGLDGDIKPSCGCAARAGAGSAGLALGLLGLIAVRRRRHGA